MSHSNRIPVIEVLRGLAALSVALFHFTGQMTTAIPQFLHAYGWLGVDVFFVISGAVIPLSLFGKDYRLRDFPTFMLRRLVRLEPAYLASIFITLMLWHASGAAPRFQGEAPNYSIGQLVSHLLYVIPLTAYHWVNPVYWSLAYEFVFYIIVGLTFSSLISRPIEVTGVAALTAVALAGFLLSGIDPRIAEFGIGALLMRGMVQPSLLPRIVPWMAALMLTIFIGSEAISVVIVGATMAAILLLRRREFGPWAIYCGAISYSLYLLHVPIGGRVINLGNRFGTGEAFDCLLIMLALAVSLLSAWLLVRLIEQPSMRASRRVTMPRSA